MIQDLKSLTQMTWISLVFVTMAAMNTKTINATDEEPSTSSETSSPVYSAEDRNHWSFRPIRSPAIPQFETDHERRWIANPVDAFILEKLTASGLKPSSRADRRTLIRRLYYDLTGLPPSLREIQLYLDDDSPDAWPKLIDRVLASPHYGEKWGQHWLDVIRFAESEGFEYDRHHETAWRLRDYVIRSFNEDKPFDQFATEQLAGDELAAASDADPRTDEILRDQVVAAGFHRLGPVRRNAGNPEIAFSRNEVLTEMTDAVGTVFLGLTVGCARCHDHFFDPLKQRDYYHLQAFFAATNEFDFPFTDRREWTSWKKQTEDINQQIYKLKDESSNANPRRTEEIKKQIEALKEQLPAKIPTLFSVKNVVEKRTPIHLLNRGVETLRVGDRLGMRVPGVFLPDEAHEHDPETVRPKTKLARWVTSPTNPLTARVIINRVWQYHFGQALVTTPNDFGLNGDEPSHPALLDWLASQMIESEWSLKSIHRLILTSNSWQQSSSNLSESETLATETDPQNRLLWKFSRRRQTAEEIRDSLLMVSGTLNSRFTGKSVITPVDPELVKLLYKPDQWVITKDVSEHRRRSVYLIAKRNLKLPFMEVFDQPDLQTSCECREVSTHAPQSLELLNGRLSNELAKRFAQRVSVSSRGSEPQLIQSAFEQTTGNKPTAEQLTEMLEFLKTQPVSELTLALFNLNAFLYID